MTTPAPAAVKPSDSDMLAAMFRAFSRLVPGAWQNPARGHADTLSQLRHYGADDADLTVISEWLSAQPEVSP